MQSNLRTKFPLRKPVLSKFFCLADAEGLIAPPHLPAAFMPIFRQHPCWRLPSGRHKTGKLVSASAAHRDRGITRDLPRLGPEKFLRARGFVAYCAST